MSFKRDIHVDYIYQAIVIIIYNIDDAMHFICLLYLFVHITIIPSRHMNIWYKLNTTQSITFIMCLPGQDSNLDRMSESPSR